METSDDPFTFLTKIFFNFLDLAAAPGPNKVSKKVSKKVRKFESLFFSVTKFHIPHEETLISKLG